MLKNKKFWTYEYSQSYELKQEFLDSYKQKGKFYDDVTLFFDIMGMTPHPSLKLPFGKDNIEPNIVSFVNILVDTNTLRILFAVLPNCKVITLKFSSNSMDYNNLEFLINSLLNVNKPTNIFNFIFEWNFKIKIEGNTYYLNEMNKYQIYDINIYNQLLKAQQLICKLGTSNKLEALCLRGNYLGDESALILFEYLKHNQFLKVLNLFKNNLSSKSTESLCHMIEINRKIEELHIGGNFFIDDDLSHLKNYVGKIQMTHEEVEVHNKKVKDRDYILEKNKKLKIQKKPEEPVPLVEEATQINGTYYIIKNTKLKNFNLMQNRFTDNCFSCIKYMLDVSSELLLTIDGNIFTKNSKDVLTDQNGPYSNRLYLTK